MFLILTYIQRTLCGLWFCNKYQNPFLNFPIIGWCTDWRPSQHWMFQMANILFFVSYCVPTSYYGIVFMHSTLVAGRYYTVIIISVLIVLFIHLKFWLNFYLFKDFSQLCHFIQKQIYKLFCKN